MQYIFSDISEEDLTSMLACFQARTQNFSPGETLMQYSRKCETIGVILSGQAQLIKDDFDGYRSIIEYLETNSVFGELLIRPFPQESFSVIAETQVKALFFDYRHLIKRCPKACLHHSILTNNMLQILSEHSRYLHMRINILSQRTLRGKLLAYFQTLAAEQNSSSFTLPFPLYSLADYLFVDRSAMMREMKKLREEQLIESHGRNVRLLSLPSKFQ